MYKEDRKKGSGTGTPGTDPLNGHRLRCLILGSMYDRWNASSNVMTRNSVVDITPEEMGGREEVDAVLQELVDERILRRRGTSPGKRNQYFLMKAVEPVARSMGFDIGPTGILRTRTRL